MTNDVISATSNTFNNRTLLSATAVLVVTMLFAGIAATSAPNAYATLSSQTSSISIRTIDGSNQNEITGYYTTLWQNGAMADWGYSAATFSIKTGPQTYQVAVSDYGKYVFDHWDLGSGQTNFNRMMTVSTNTGTHLALTAVYKNTSNPPPPTESKIIVKTVDINGNQINGYYTTLWQNGQKFQSGFSTATFIVTSGNAYQVAVADYGSYVFDHWSDDGSKSRFHSVGAVPGSTTSLTAVYVKVS